MDNQHPKVIEGSKRIIGYTPSGCPLIAWDELYPDGSIQAFGEFWTSCTATSGTTYGLSVVHPTESNRVQ